MDNERETLGIRAEFVNAIGKLKGGLFVRIRIQAGTIKDAVSGPVVALGRDQQGAYLFVVGKDNVVERRSVKVGPQTEDGLVILSGVDATDTVIVNGMMSARPGAPVQIKQDS